MRDSMILYRSFVEAIGELDQADQLAAFWAVIRYGLDEREPECTGAAKAIYRMAKPQIDVNNKRYQNGARGGRPKRLEEEEEPAGEETGPEPNNNQDQSKEKPNQNQRETKGKPKRNQNETNPEPNVNENVNENENVKDSKDFCPESEKSAPAIWGEFLLNDGSLYSVTENDVVRYQQLYPGIDCMAELRKIIGWCEANPKYRKTRTGAKRFVNAWLARAQDRSVSGREPARKAVNSFHNFEQRKYDYDDLMKRLTEKKELEKEAGAKGT